MLICKRISKDWCHLCGTKESNSCDVFYPRNAEHETENTNYIRICSKCAEDIIDECEFYEDTENNINIEKLSSDEAFVELIKLLDKNDCYLDKWNQEKAYQLLSKIKPLFEL